MENQNFKQAAIRGQQIIIEKMIRTRMLEKKMTAYSLSKHSGISEATLSRWLSGQQNITLTVFLAICGALDITYFEVKESFRESQSTALPPQY